MNCNKTDEIGICQRKIKCTALHFTCIYIFLITNAIEISPLVKFLLNFTVKTATCLGCDTGTIPFKQNKKNPTTT
jgi:hypothetical protein